jgi:hypothetical protein
LLFTQIANFHFYLFPSGLGHALRLFTPGQRNSPPGRVGLFTAHRFLAVLEENLNLLQADHTLHKTEAENRMVYQILNLVSTCHGIVRRLCAVHARPEDFPLFALYLFRLNGSSSHSGFFPSRGWPILVLTTAGIALHFNRDIFGHGNYDVVGISAAFSAAGFDRITSGKRGVLHNGTPFLEASQDMPYKNQGDRWNLRDRFDN